MDKSLEAFGEALRTARLAAGLNQKALGSALDVTASAVGNWERGIDEPSPARVRQLEEAMDLTPGWLSRHLGYVPLDAGDGTDLNSRAARLPDAAQRFINDYIDAEERRMEGR